MADRLKVQKQELSSPSSKMVAFQRIKETIGNIPEIGLLADAKKLLDNGKWGERVAEIEKKILADLADEKIETATWTATLDQYRQEIIIGLQRYRVLLKAKAQADLATRIEAAKLKKTEEDKVQEIRSSSLLSNEVPQNLQGPELHPGECGRCHLRIVIYDRPKCLWGGFTRKPATDGGKCPLLDSKRDKTFDNPYETTGVSHNHETLTESSIRPPEPWPAEIETMIAWLKSTDLPKSFGLHFAPGASGPYVTVTDGRRFKADLLSELAQGPHGPRARYGVVQLDLETVYRLFGLEMANH